MSISELSSTMQEAIIDRLRKRLRATTLDDIAEYDTDSIRDITNRKSSGYEAVLSRGNLQTLSEQFNNESRFKNNSEFKKVTKIAGSISELEALALEAASILSNPALFNNFILYLSSGASPKFKKNKGELEYSNLSDSVKMGRVSPEPSSSDIIIFRENHGDLAKVFREFLSTDKSGVTYSSTKVLDFIKEQLDAGHLVGIFNIRLKRILNLRSTSNSSAELFSISNTKTNNDELTTLLNAVNSLFIQADYLSSNTILDPDIFLTAEKRVYSESPSVTVELQLSLKNKDAGNKLAAISRSLNDLITAIRGRDAKVRGRVDAVGAKLALDKFLKGVSKLSADLSTNAAAISKGIDIGKSPKAQKAINEVLNNTQTISTLIGAKGSDSIEEAILYSMVAGLLGKKVPAKQVTTINKSSTGNNKTPNTTKKFIGKKPIPSKKPTSRVVPIKSTPDTYFNLTAIQNLINANLAEKIKENMGGGNARNVLNLRSGRLAESAQVERMSQSRAGMITAFYSYMKNPYATFSAGGRQQDPKSRDPKLLIAKSIREIAAQQVGNRLRSVAI